MTSNFQSRSSKIKTDKTCPGCLCEPPQAPHSWGKTGPETEVLRQIPVKGGAQRLAHRLLSVGLRGANSGENDCSQGVRGRDPEYISLLFAGELS